MPGPVERWLETFMCKQYADTFEAYGFKTLQSVCQLQVPQLQAMGVSPEHCEKILENVSVLRQTMMGMNPYADASNGPTPYMNNTGEQMRPMNYHHHPGGAAPPASMGGMGPPLPLHFGAGQGHPQDGYQGQRPPVLPGQHQSHYGNPYISQADYQQMPPPVQSPYGGQPGFDPRQGYPGNGSSHNLSMNHMIPPQMGSTTPLFHSNMSPGGNNMHHQMRSPQMPGHMQPSPQQVADSILQMASSAYRSGPMSNMNRFRAPSTGPSSPQIAQNMRAQSQYMYPNAGQMPTQNRNSPISPMQVRSPASVHSSDSMHSVSPAPQQSPAASLPSPGIHGIKSPTAIQPVHQSPASTPAQTLASPAHSMPSTQSPLPPGGGSIHHASQPSPGGYNTPLRSPNNPSSSTGHFSPNSMPLNSPSSHSSPTYPICSAPSVGGGGSSSLSSPYLDNSSTSSQYVTGSEGTNQLTNPLQSLQKLVMLPESQVVDPKSVVNDGCLSGEGGSKNGEGGESVSLDLAGSPLPCTDGKHCGSDTEGLNDRRFRQEAPLLASGLPSCKLNPQFPHDAEARISDFDGKAFLDISDSIGYKRNGNNNEMNMWSGGPPPHVGPPQHVGPPPYVQNRPFDQSMGMPDPRAVYDFSTAEDAPAFSNCAGNPAGTLNPPPKKKRKKSKAKAKKEAAAAAAAAAAAKKTECLNNAQDKGSSPGAQMQTSTSIPPLQQEGAVQAGTNQELPSCETQNTCGESVGASEPANGGSSVSAHDGREVTSGQHDTEKPSENSEGHKPTDSGAESSSQSQERHNLNMSPVKLNGEVEQTENADTLCTNDNDCLPVVDKNEVLPVPEIARGNERNTNLTEDSDKRISQDMAGNHIVGNAGSNELESAITKDKYCIKNCSSGKKDSYKDVKNSLASPPDKRLRKPKMNQCPNIDLYEAAEDIIGGLVNNNGCHSDELFNDAPVAALSLNKCSNLPSKDGSTNVISKALGRNKHVNHLHNDVHVLSNGPSSLLLASAPAISNDYSVGSRNMRHKKRTNVNVRLFESDDEGGVSEEDEDFQLKPSMHNCISSATDDTVKPLGTGAAVENCIAKPVSAVDSNHLKPESPKSEVKENGVEPISPVGKPLLDEYESKVIKLIKNEVSISDVKVNSKVCTSDVSISSKDCASDSVVDTKVCSSDTEMKSCTSDTNAKSKKGCVSGEMSDSEVIKSEPSVESKASEEKKSIVNEPKSSDKTNNSPNSLEKKLDNSFAEVVDSESCTNNQNCQETPGECHDDKDDEDTGNIQETPRKEVVPASKDSAHGVIDEKETPERFSVPTTPRDSTPSTSGDSGGKRKRGRPVGSKNKMKGTKRKRKKGKTEDVFDFESEHNESFKNMNLKRTYDIMSKVGKKGRKGKNKVLEVALKEKERIMGPYVQIRGDPDAPKKCVVVNLPDNDNDKLKKKKSHGTSESQFERPAVLPPVSSLNESIPFQCALCGKASNYKMLGDLFGPYFPENTPTLGPLSPNSSECKPNEKEIMNKDSEGDKKKRRRKSTLALAAQKMTTRKSKSPEQAKPETDTVPSEIWVHEDCVVWSHGVCLVGSKVYGLEDAITVAKQTVCTACKTTGATVGCLSKGCSQNFHFICATEKECAFDEENFSLLCPKHKGKKLKGKAAVSAT